MAKKIAAVVEVAPVVVETKPTKTSKKPSKIERGAKAAAIIELARRRTGVSGAEIIELTGWPVGNAKERVSKLAATTGFTAARLERPDGTVAYRLAGRATA